MWTWVLGLVGFSTLEHPESNVYGYNEEKACDDCNECLESVTHGHGEQKERIQQTKRRVLCYVVIIVDTWKFIY